MKEKNEICPIVQPGISNCMTEHSSYNDRVALPYYVHLKVNNTD